MSVIASSRAAILTSALPSPVPEIWTGAGVKAGEIVRNPVLPRFKKRGVWGIDNGGNGLV